MNKVQYQLIKTYPGSAPINSIFEFATTGVRYESGKFSVKIEDLKNTEFFKKINICPMLNKLIRLVQDVNVRGSKSNKKVYRVNGFTWNERHFQICEINNEKEISQVLVNSKNYVEVFQYWFIDSKGKTQSDFHTSEELLNQNEHSYRKSIGNYFQTKIEASVVTIKVTLNL